MSKRTTYKERFRHGARFTLRGMRLAQRLSQRDLAARMGTYQSNVSLMERDSVDCHTARTLRSYVEALGGKLEIVVVMSNGGRFIIVDPQE